MPDIELEKYGIHAMHGMRLKPYNNHLAEIVEKDPFLRAHVAKSYLVQAPLDHKKDSMQFEFKFDNGCDAIFTDYNGYFGTVLASRQERELFGIQMAEDDRFTHKIMGDSLLMFAISGKSRDDITRARDAVITKFPVVAPVNILPETQKTRLDELANVCEIRHAESMTEDFNPIELMGERFFVLYHIFAKSRSPELPLIIQSHRALRTRVSSHGMSEDNDIYYATLKQGEATIIMSDTLPNYDHSCLYLSTGERLDPEIFSVLTIMTMGRDRERNYDITDELLQYFADRPLIPVKAPRYFIDTEIQDLSSTLIDLETTFGE